MVSVLGDYANLVALQYPFAIGIALLDIHIPSDNHHSILDLPR
jgi:hypothetical protein